MRTWSVLVFVVLVGCRDDALRSDPDSTVQPDSSMRDSSQSDAIVTPPFDARLPDASVVPDALVVMDASQDATQPDATMQQDASLADASEGDASGGDTSVPDASGTLACATSSCAGSIVISEFRTSGPDGASDEFVEVHNRTGSPVDVEGMELHYVSTGGTDFTRAAVSGSTIVPAGGYLLYSSTKYSGTEDVPDRWTTGFASGGGTIYLTAGGGEIDRVGWGTATSFETAAFAPAVNPCDVSCERKAKASSTAATMQPGGADVSAGNGYDTGDNSADFVVRTASDPQTSNDSVELP